MCHLAHLYWWASSSAVAVELFLLRCCSPCLDGCSLVELTFCCPPDWWSFWMNLGVEVSLVWLIGLDWIVLFYFVFVFAWVLGHFLIPRSPTFVSPRRTPAVPSRRSVLGHATPSDDVSTWSVRNWAFGVEKVLSALWCWCVHQELVLLVCEA